MMFSEILVYVKLCPFLFKQEIDFFFGPKSPEVNASLENCTLCIIKPHAVASGMSGQIMAAITEAGFTINALQMFRLEKANAEEFYEIYKGVVNEYSVSRVSFRRIKIKKPEMHFIVKNIVDRK